MGAPPSTLPSPSHVQSPMVTNGSLRACSLGQHQPHQANVLPPRAPHLFQGITGPWTSGEPWAKKQRREPYVGREPEALGRGLTAGCPQTLLRGAVPAAPQPCDQGHCPYVPPRSPLSAGIRVLAHRAWRGLKESLRGRASTLSPLNKQSPLLPQ